MSNDPVRDAVEAKHFTPESLAISSHLPDLINQYISIRAQRLRFAKEVEAMEETEKGLHDAIVTKFREGDITAQGATNGLVKMTTLIEPTVSGENWPIVWDYIKETGDFSLLHKRITVTAVKERWEAGIEVPGVGRMTKYKLSVSGTK